jgi:hypothetical protein
MTDPKTHLKGCYLKKQSQFTGGIYRLYSIIYNDLGGFSQLKTAKKQSQFKAGLEVD